MIDILASITGNGPRVGKYYVNLLGCRFAAERLINALVSSEIIICDEIGPMELKSKELVDVVKNLLNTGKKVIVVMHQKLEHPLAHEFRKKSSSLISINLRTEKGLSKYCSIDYQLKSYLQYNNYCSHLKSEIDSFFMIQGSTRS